MGAEDFSFMLNARPGAMLWLGNGPGEGGCLLHNPNYDFNDEALPIGASFFARLAERFLARQDRGRPPNGIAPSARVPSPPPTALPFRRLAAQLLRDFKSCLVRWPLPC